MENEGEFSDSEVEKILREALTEKLRADKKKRKIPKSLEDKEEIPYKTRANNALISSIAEFLSCYTLIGYNLDGEPITLNIYANPMQKSALDNAFIEMFYKKMGK